MDFQIAGFLCPRGSAHYREYRIDFLRALGEWSGAGAHSVTVPPDHEEELKREIEVCASGGSKALWRYWRDKGVVPEVADHG